MPDLRGLVLCSVTSAVATLAACAHPSPPTSGPFPVASLVKRHYDQVCYVDMTERPTLRVSEILDTTGLAAELARIPVRPLPPDTRSGHVRWRTLDFIARYGRSGRAGPTGVWETTLDPERATRVGAILEARVARLSGLLEPKGFRVVVVFGPRPTVTLGNPVACLPHMVHEEGRRPTGLPRGVRTWLESDRFRPYRTPFQRDPTGTVRIHLDREGRVTAVDSLAGDAATMSKVRDIVTRLSFDPALSNGEAVVGAFVQSFAFPTGRGPGGPQELRPLSGISRQSAPRPASRFPGWFLPETTPDRPVAMRPLEIPEPEFRAQEVRDEPPYPCCRAP